MAIKLMFPVHNEQHSVAVHLPGKAFLQADYPLLVTHLNGRSHKLRYHSISQLGGKTIAVAKLTTVKYSYTVTDTWCAEDNLISIERTFYCEKAVPGTSLRLTTGFESHMDGALSFADYQLVVPAAFYNKNDTDLDGVEDYRDTYNQDYKDDRNPSLSITCFSPKSKSFISLLRADLPQKDKTLTREQLDMRHFVHDTDIGSLGFCPSQRNQQDVVLRCDYPFCERFSYCLNVDGSEWAAYKAVTAGESFSVTYLLYIDSAKDLTEASWQTTALQMDRILDDRIPLPFSLEEAKKYRTDMIANSYREFPDKKECPAGYFIHFSPRKEYGENFFLEYGFCGVQTQNSCVMLHAADEQGKEAYRSNAVKTNDFFTNHCIAASGLPEGIYDVENEEFVYWWSGILFPFQYTKTRKELEKYVGWQIVTSLTGIADELNRVKGNYTRTMCEAMYYLMRSYIYEKSKGHDHERWLSAVVAFGDKMLALQNEDGSWYRAYTLEGEPITSPAEWFGASWLEQRCGAIFPCQVLVELYEYTGDKKYLESADRAARFISNTYVKDVTYVGGLNDTTHKKCVKIDTLGVMFNMRSMFMVYKHTKNPDLLSGARDAARILASWVFLWDVPFDKNTLLGKYGFKTTGWAGCDVLPGGSYVDDTLTEYMPDLLQIAECCNDRKLAKFVKIVMRGMQHGLSMPGHMYGYAMPGVQCEGYMTSLWLSDCSEGAFSGAASKNKGDDNDTCNGFINCQNVQTLDYLQTKYGTLDFDRIFEEIFPER